MNRIVTAACAATAVACLALPASSLLAQSGQDARKLAAKHDGNVHYPQFSGYEYPIIAIIVDLEEGERMASQLVECEPEDITIGMALEAVIQEDEDGFKIPFFKPAS